MPVLLGCSVPLGTPVSRFAKDFRQPRGSAASVAFQFCVISAAAVFILPSTILLPGFHHALVYIAERMSLGVGICVCRRRSRPPAPRAYQRSMHSPRWH